MRLTTDRNHRPSRRGCVAGWQQLHTTTNSAATRGASKHRESPNASPTGTLGRTQRCALFCVEFVAFYFFFSIALVCSTIMYSTVPYCTSTVVPTAVCSAPDVTSFSLLPVSSNHCVVERSWALFVFRCLLFCSSLSRYCCVDESTEMQVHYPITTTFSKECCDVPHGWLVVVIAVVEGWRGACTGNLTVVAGMMQHPAPPRRLDDGDEQQQQSPVPTIGRRPLEPLLLDGGGTVTDFCREDGLVQAKQVLSGITEHIFIVRVESS